MPAELAAEITRAKARRPAGLAGGARRVRLLPLPRRARPPHRAAPRATSRASTARRRHPYDALLDDFEPGLTTAELRPLFAELRDGLVPLVAAAGDPEQPRNDGVFTGAYPVAEQRAAVLDAPRRPRLRPRPLAPGPVRPPVRPEPGADRRPAHHQVRRERLRRGALLGAARVRARPLRGVRGPAPGAHPAGRAGLARRARVPEPHVGEHRRALAAVLRLAAPAPARAVSPGRFEAIDAAASTARSTRPAVADPDRGRRDDLQPAHHPALRARAGADRGLARGRRPARAPGTRGRERLLGVEVPERRRGRAPGHPLGRRADRLLPDLHARQPDGRAALGAPGARPAGRRRASRAPATSRRCASGCASTSTATAASSPARAAAAGHRGGAPRRPLPGLPARQARRRRAARARLGRDRARPANCEQAFVRCRPAAP